MYGIPGVAFVQQSARDGAGVTNGKYFMLKHLRMLAWPPSSPSFACRNDERLIHGSDPEGHD
jgi:hypothetical protein